LNPALVARRKASVDRTDIALRLNRLLVFSLDVEFALQSKEFHPDVRNFAFVNDFLPG